MDIAIVDNVVSRYSEIRLEIYRKRKPVVKSSAVMGGGY